MSIRTRLPTVRLRRPEYTGENRCYPCTALNLVMAGMLGVVGWLISPPLGIAVVLVSLAAIYFRGYLVPGTPAFTRRYFPDRVLAWFDKEPVTEPVEDADFNPEAALLEWGVLEWCEGGTDLCFTGDVRAEVDAMVDRFRDDPRDEDRIARMFDTEVDDLRELDRGTPTYVIHGRVQRWPSEVAVLSDTAVNAALDEFVDEWDTRPLAHRLQVLEGLRPFHERCPACDGVLTTGETVVESCCRSKDVVQVRCDDCESVLFEIDAAAIGDV